MKLTEQVCRACGICTIEDARAQCESCGMPLWNGTTYRVPGLHGRYCSITCVELDLAGRSACHWCFAEGVASGTKRSYCDDVCRKQASGNSFGNGVRLLNFLQRTRPDLYRQVICASESKDENHCSGCGTRTAGTLWCGDTCRKRHARKSSTRANGGKMAETHIQNKGLNFSNLPGKGIASTGQGAPR